MATRMKLKDLERLAQETGYPDYRTLLYELYVVQRIGLYELAARCHMHYRRVRKHLIRFGIQVRGRGGANNVKIVLTPQLLREVMKDGIPAVADRLGVHSSVLRARLKALERTVTGKG